MKANEAPEKIWVHELSAKELIVPMKEYHVEYTRTDAFIKKTCEWLRLNLSNYFDDTREGFDLFIDDFKKYMEDSKV